MKFLHIGIVIISHLELLLKLDLSVVDTAVVRSVGLSTLDLLKLLLVIDIFVLGFEATVMSAVCTTDVGIEVSLAK